MVGPQFSIDDKRWKAFLFDNDSSAAAHFTITQLSDYRNGQDLLTVLVFLTLLEGVFVLLLTITV